MSVRVRIAPSPTGDPHVGTAYIALFNYCFARKNDGAFVLRIEDTDRTRSRPESEAAIMRALSWVGVTWDEGPDKGGPYGPYRQSERAEIYATHAKILVSKGAAYRCFCTPERLTQLREEQKLAKKDPGYDRRCRSIPADDAARREAAGETFTVRLAMPDGGATVFKDALRGELSFENATIDDQVLLKSDGFPTYHLANVVDDHLMKITHVIRAEEWISSTPKHVQLYAAFGWQAPEWIHMPLLRNADKSKISKRKNPVSVDYYRDAGILPEALLNFLGRMGWSLPSDPDKEKFTLEEMVREFDIGRVSLGGPVFDLEKLTWLNSLYLRDLTDEEMVARLRAWRLSDEKLVHMAKLVRERVRRLDEFVPAVEFFLSGDLDYGAVAAEMIPKGRSGKETAKMLSELIDAVEAMDGPFAAPALEAVARKFSETSGWKTKELFMTLRLVVTGRKASPGLFETMEVIGKELLRRRVRQAAELLKGM